MPQRHVQHHSRTLPMQCRHLPFRWWVWVVPFLLAFPCSAAVQGQFGPEGVGYADSSVAAAPPDSPRPFDTIWSDTKAVFTEGVQIFSAPLRFGGTEWGIAGGVAAGTGLLMTADHQARKTLTQTEDTLANRLSEIGNYYGTLLPGLAVSAGLYSGGLIFDEPSVRRAGRHVFQAMLYAGTITTVAKMLIGRHRPFLNDGEYVFDGPSTKDEYFSLPSGHATVAFSISSALAADIDHPAATVALYSLATLTALSRIYSDRHWLSDTFLGAAIGTACGYGVVHLGDPPGPESSSWILLPTSNGVMLRWSGLLGGSSR